MQMEKNSGKRAGELLECARKWTMTIPCLPIWRAAATLLRNCCQYLSIVWHFHIWSDISDTFHPQSKSLEREWGSLGENAHLNRTWRTEGGKQVRDPWVSNSQVASYSLFLPPRLLLLHCTPALAPACFRTGAFTCLPNLMTAKTIPDTQPMQCSTCGKRQEGKINANKVPLGSRPPA